MNKLEWYVIGVVCITLAFLGAGAEAILVSAAGEKSLFIETAAVGDGRYILRPVYVKEREGKKYRYDLAPLANPVVQKAYRAKIRELNPDGKPYDEMVFKWNWMGDPLSMLVTFR